jgi:tetratricopeptide (TPR) repeat protein
MVAQARRDLDAAEKWYRKSLEIAERLGDEHGAAITYHQLGMVAQARRDLDAAEKWYRKSLEIKERLGDEHGAAITYHQLGMVAQERRDFEAAWGWFLKALGVFVQFGDNHSVGIVARSLARSYRDAPAEVRPRLMELGRKAGLPDEFLKQIEEFANQPPPTGS